MNIKSSIKATPIEDKIYYSIVYAIVILLLITVVYPILYVVSSSFSSSSAIQSGKVFVFPVGFNIIGYKAVFKTNEVLVGYRNTIFYTFFGTLLNVSMTMICAYPMSRRDLPGKSFFTIFFAITMFFSGGMIPNYLLMLKLGIINTAWVMIVPGALSVYNMIVARTFIQCNIPGELLEASKIDGCGDFRYFWSILLPLSKPIIAVLALWGAVGYWNTYFNALLYLSNDDLYPLQLVLKNILLVNQVDPNMLLGLESQEDAVMKKGIIDVLKYALIVVSTAPLLIVFPFVQKYFVKGVMIGSIKG